MIKIFTDKEKKYLRILVNDELKKFVKEESTIIEKSIPEVELELKYEEFLKNLLKKLE